MGWEEKGTAAGTAAATREWLLRKRLRQRNHYYFWDAGGVTGFAGAGVVGEVDVAAGAVAGVEAAGGVVVVGAAGGVVGA